MFEEEKNKTLELIDTLINILDIKEQDIIRSFEN